MAQWLGQFSGKTHLSKVKDREQQLQHGIAVYHSNTSALEQRKCAKAVLRFAERLLTARVQAAKARVAAIDPRDEAGRRSAEEKINTMLSDGVDAILEEFHAKELTLSERQ